MASTKEVKFPWEGTEKITDSGARVIDVDDFTKVNLFSGDYTMYGHRLDVMIRKGVDIRWETYDLLRNFKHNSAIPLLNFYTEPKSLNMGRFIIPRVRGSFEVWVKTEGKEDLFDEKGKIKSLFKNMICDMCSVIEELHGANILIKNFSLNNLYMAAEASPRLLLLPAEVITLLLISILESCTDELAKRENWKSVKDTINGCCERAGVELNCFSKRYIGFIGSENFTVRGLKNYPENWSYEMKEEYLISLIAASQFVIRKTVKKTDLEWPIKDGKLPPLLLEILDHQTKFRLYREDAPFDYVMLIRNTYKHFDKLPQSIQVRCGDRKGFLKMIDHWTPNLWIDLFDEIGWL